MNDQRRVRVTIDFVLLFDEPQAQLPANLLPSRSRNTILDFIAAGCRANNVTGCEIQPRASFNVRFDDRPARTKRKGEG